MKQNLLITLLYLSSLIYLVTGGEVLAQVVMPDPVKRDSLIRLVEKYNQQKKELGKSGYIPADTLKADLLWEINLSDDYYKNQKACEARNEELKAISHALNYKKGIANSLSGDGGLLSMKQEYPKALALNFQALKIRQQIGDKWGIRWSHFWIGACYQWQNKNKEAMPWYMNGLKLGEAANDSTLLYLIYCGLAGIYQSLGDMKETIICAEKSSAYAYSPRSQYNYGMALTFLVSYYATENELGKADSVLKMAYKIATDINSYLHLSYYFNAKGELSALRGNYGEAILAYINSNAMEDSMHASQNKPYSYSMIVEYILKADKKELAIAGIPESKKYDEVIRYSHLALAISIPSNIMAITAENYRLLSKAYEAKGDMKQAYKYFKMGTEIKDSLYNAENTKTIQGLKMQYETEKKEQQIALLNKDKALQQTELSKQTTTRNAFIGGFVLVGLLAGVSYNRYRLKQNSNRQLSINLERLKNTQAKLVEQEKMASLGQLTAGIAHEIKNPLNFVNNFSELSKDLIDEIRSAKDDNERMTVMKDLNENISKIKHHGNRADNIVKSMMLHSRDNSGEKELADMNQLCEEVLNLSYKNVTLKFPNFHCITQKHFASALPNIQCDKEEISRVILNLLDNAFYAVRARAEGRVSGVEYKPTVTLSTLVAVALSPKISTPSPFSFGEGARRADEVGRVGEGSITISIKDNGLGIPEKIKQKIFEPFFTTKPTHEGTGLGLSICNDIIKAHGGIMKVESKENEGTEFVVTLPVV